MSFEIDGVGDVATVMATPVASVTEEVKPTKQQFKADRKSLYNDTDIKPKEIDASKFKPSDKEFCVIDNWNISDLKLELLKKTAMALFNLGYTYRSIGFKKDKIDEAIRSLPNARYKVYKLWPKAKVEPEEAVIGCEGQDPIAYSTAAAYVRNFNAKKDSRRAQLARYTNLILGPKCEVPVDFILAYTDCGSNSFSKSFNIETARDAWYGFKIAKVANIPLFNINNKNFVTDFKSHMDAITGTTLPVQQPNPQPQVVTTTTVSTPTASEPTVTVSQQYDELLP